MTPAAPEPDQEPCDTLLFLLGRLTGCASQRLAVTWPPASPDLLREPVIRHELAGALYPWVAGEATPFSPELLAAWWQANQRQAAVELLARRQLEEIAVAFAGQNLEWVALKGAAAILRLNRRPGARALLDLDLLIREAQLSAVRATMAELGYRPVANRSSEGEEELLMHHTHLRPYVRAGRLPIEFHTHVLQRRGCRDANEEIWSEAVSVACGAGTIYCPSPTHFVLHAGVHFMKDLDAGSASLKGLVDILDTICAPAASGIRWGPFWATAHRWGVEQDLGTVMATLTHYWRPDLPDVPADAHSLPATTLVLGRENRQRAAEVARFAGYLDMLQAARALPDLPSRLRYLTHLLFPTTDQLRYRYQVPPERGIGPYYLVHPARLARRLARSASAHIRQWLRSGRPK